MIQFDDFLWRGPRPKSMADLQEQGFKHVVDLESGAFQFFHDDRYELDGTYLNEFSVEKTNYWLSDVFAPKIKIIKLIVGHLKYCDEKQIKTYIHCLHGNDRTGIVVAAYRILINGWSVNDAIEEMYQMGFHKWPYLYLLNWPRQLRKLKC